MTAESLVVTVRFYTGRYHGREDGFDGAEGWPPSPGRLFQALVAGAARGGKLLAEDERALTWLERLDPPRIAAPPARRGRAVKLFVPNNDLDAVGGDPRRVHEIRVGKNWRPCYFDHQEPVLYVWDFGGGTSEAESICLIALRLYQLGRGIDMACANAGVTSREDADAVLENHPGIVRTPGGSGLVATPVTGSLASLVERHRLKRTRLTTEVSGGKPRQLFRQPPRALFRHVGYDVPPRELHFELRLTDGAFSPWPLTAVMQLLVGLRDQAASRLSDSLPSQSATVEKLVSGKGAGTFDLPQRIRMLPIPSIGAEHADMAIRRVLIEVPVECPVRVDDLRWAFAGLKPFEQEKEGAYAGMLVSTSDSQMADRFGRSARLYRTVTPAVLPGGRRRRLGAGDTKSGGERASEEAQSRIAVMQALRHAGIRARPTDIRVQREPFQRRGGRADLFDVAKRFSKHALWHVEVRFSSPIPGPLVIGDGRFCGLGLMAPVVERPGVIAFELGRPVRREDGPPLVGHLRRALMALARDDGGRVGKLFSGHQDNGQPDDGGHHDHVFLAADGPTAATGPIERLVVVAPWAAARRAGDGSQRQFDEVTGTLVELVAGALGRFGALQARPVEDGDPVIGPASVWSCVTPFVATRNCRSRDDLAEVIKLDVVVECARRGLPSPKKVDLTQLRVGPRGGRPSAMVTLRFAKPVRGPLLLGRESHIGGGLFHCAS